MDKKLTQEEINARFAEINSQEPEDLSPDEIASLREAEAMDDGSTISYEELKRDLQEYSGKLVLRIPKSLHKHLKQEAEIEGVSLNQYMLYKLSK